MRLILNRSILKQNIFQSSRTPHAHHDLTAAFFDFVGVEDDFDVFVEGAASFDPF